MGAGAGAVLQMKVTLLETDPPIWRRFLISEDSTVEKLHLVIQAVMGWENCHAHVFEKGDQRIGTPDPENAIVSGKGYFLRDLKQKEGFSIHYEYDFGDSWEHEVTIEKVLPDDGTRYPVCSAGERACPPEDCGGVSGFYDIIKVMRDPNHARHSEVIQWLGGKFDPEAFDLDDVNKKLRRFRVLVPRAAKAPKEPKAYTASTTKEVPAKRKRTGRKPSKQMEHSKNLTRSLILVSAEVGCTIHEAFTEIVDRIGLPAIKESGLMKETEQKCRVLDKIVEKGLSDSNSTKTIALADLRKALGVYGREDFDRWLRELAQEGTITLVVAADHVGLTKRERDAAFTAEKGGLVSHVTFVMPEVKIVSTPSRKRPKGSR